MLSPVTFVSEDKPGVAWQSAFKDQWPSYRRWFLKDGLDRRPTRRACEAALRRHMPELLGLWAELTELAGDDDVAARFLSMYCPPRYMGACSQAVWGRQGSLLVRNYDYISELWEGRVWRTRWLGRPVLGVSDCMWGLLDGVNDAGLCLSLAFGGRRVVGEGFGIPLIMRYVLQTAETSADATSMLARIPSHMAYNVSVVDRHGSFETVHVSPDRPARLTRCRVATNHQGHVDWPEYAAATGSVDRFRVLQRRVADPDETAARFVRRFLEPPVYTRAPADGWGTLYTAVYTPASPSLVLLWPDATKRYALIE